MFSCTLPDARPYSCVHYCFSLLLRCIFFNQNIPSCSYVFFLLLLHIRIVVQNHTKLDRLEPFVVTGDGLMMPAHEARIRNNTLWAVMFQCKNPCSSHTATVKLCFLFRSVK